MPENKSIQAFGPADDRGGRNVPALTDAAIRNPNYGSDVDPQEQRIPVAHYVWILRRQAWKIFCFVIITTVATLLISKRITPIYESTATLDIDRQTPVGIIGQDANRAALNDADQFLATQMRLIQSDSVLRPVVDQYKLRDREKDQMSVAATNSVSAHDAPVLLRNLKVVRPPNTYLLLVSYRSIDPWLAANVANAVSRSFLESTYRIRFQSSENLSAFMEKQLEELRAKMERSSMALAQFEKDLSVINPEQKTSILSARLLQLNTDFTNAQIERVRKETAFKSVNKGTLEAAQVSSQGEALKKLTERLDEAQQKFADVKLHYGLNHPEYKKAIAQVQEIQRQIQQSKDNIGQRIAVEYNDSVGREAMLKSAFEETKAEYDRMNVRSFEYQALKREADADKKLYEELTTKIKEAGINAGFQGGTAKIADLARPAITPVFPNLKLNLALAFLFSTLLGIGAAVVSDMMDTTVRDPEQVMLTLKTEVVGTLPTVKRARDLMLNAESGSLVPMEKQAEQHVAHYNEAIRTLRNSILLTDFDRRIRSILITSSSPKEGKSTIAAHLAIAHAQQGRKTLLIDCDLRRPSVHIHLDMSSKLGLSCVLTDEMSWQDAVIQHPTISNLSILLAGPPSRRSIDLLGNGLPGLLETAGKDYDLIIVDSPPLLGFPEPLQMAVAVDGVLVVARSAQTTRRALGVAINTLTRLRANVLGVVMNDIHSGSSAGQYYQYYSAKYYRHYRTNPDSNT